MSHIGNYNLDFSAINPRPKSAGPNTQGEKTFKPYGLDFDEYQEKLNKSSKEIIEMISESLFKNGYVDFKFMEDEFIQNLYKEGFNKSQISRISSVSVRTVTNKLKEKKENGM